jgi:hypothetical protein
VYGLGKLSGAGNRSHQWSSYGRCAFLLYPVSWMDILTKNLTHHLVFNKCGS